MLMGCCGLVCSECKGYLATMAQDAELAAQTAKEWSAAYGVEVLPEHVWCTGCTEEGQKCAHCARCEVRSCATIRGLATCAECADFGCETLSAFLQFVPQAGLNLNARRAARGL